MRLKRVNLQNSLTALLVALMCVFAVATPQRAPQKKSASSGSAATASKHRATRSAGRAGASKGKQGAAAARPSGRKAKARGKASAHGGRASHAREQAPSPRSLRLASAFRASAELRPMAQQLAAQRSPAAFAGVEAYARANPGDGATAAYLALGHAYSLDRRYPEAVAAFRQAAASDALGDYADYLGAQAAMRASQPDAARQLLQHFGERYPESIFRVSAPVLLASIDAQQGDGAAALQVLEPMQGSDGTASAEFRYALARAYQTAGQTARAAELFREIYLKQPLAGEASQAKQQLQAMGSPLSAAQRKLHADALFNAKHYAEAAEEYHALEHDEDGLSENDRAALLIYTAVCELRLKRIGRREIDKLPVTNDDSAALKLYLQAEISRSEGNRGDHDALIQQLVDHYPASRWTEEALYSGGNMYLLLHDPTQAIYHYGLLVKLFPQSTYAPSAHWRMAWMNYRLRRYPEAARLMEEQVVRYPGGQEIPSALFWRARIFEDEEHNLPQAALFYRALSRAYANFWYAGLARQRLTVLGAQPSEAPSPVLAGVHPPEIPPLTGDLPENDPHLIKARLLANAALNEYITPEIQASDTAEGWGALAQAEIYTSFGEVTRALQSMKHSGLPFFTLPIGKVPEVYWRLLFPRPYWPEIVADSQANGLDPYLVASLIRQESEFNAGAVSRANAYGLMQLLPSVGKSIAKKQKLKGFSAAQLLVPAVNLQLGTINLREVVNRYGGQMEYVLAAYNAGDVPVRQWMAQSDYKDIAEFVESIPYTETRDYVQAILRNREMYRALYGGK